MSCDNPKCNCTNCISSGCTCDGSKVCSCNPENANCCCNK